MLDNRKEPIILEPDPSRIMEGLRDTGYDFNTAIADLLDNCIAANATKIVVHVSRSSSNGEISLYIADNGDGMDYEGLLNAMTYGAKKRTDPSSLGKFGLGLKTASTAFCRSLSLISKNSSDAEYFKVEWDLDLICQVNKWELQTPKITQDEIDFLEEVTEGKSGTLVIWQKVDRLIRKQSSASNSIDKTFTKIVNELSHHLSKVYERFLNGFAYGNSKKLNIVLNGQNVYPYDPFCLSEPQNQIVADQVIQLEGPNKQKFQFTIKAYILPRTDEFSTPNAKKQARINNDNQGFYIYRENRLIKSGSTLGMFTKDPHFSLLRLDFSFDHNLDDTFKVDLKKSTITLNEETYDHIINNILPAPRRAAEEKYRKGTNRIIQAKTKDIHSGSNVNINEKAPTLEQATIEVVDKDKGEVVVTNHGGAFRGQFTVLTIDENKPIRVVPVDTIESGMLWEPTIVNNNQAVSINQSHDFYKKVYAVNSENANLISALDSLLWALSEAEWSTYNDEVKEHYEDMRISVSKILKKLVKDLPDPDIN
jgi:hypothetical protein